MATKNLMRDRQRPLMKQYETNPASAWTTDEARTIWRDDDPLHSIVSIGPHNPAQVPVGVHLAVGGDSDEPTPGDILCAALASCVDSTLRIVANRLGIDIVALTVVTFAEVDVRGTLGVSAEVPVGFQKFTVQVDLELGDEVSQEHRERLLKASERCCIVMDTLKKGVDVTMTSDGASRRSAPGLLSHS